MSMTVREMSLPLNPRGPRYSYAFKPRHLMKHLVQCNLYDGDPEETIVQALRAMALNPLLESLVEKTCYRWVGFSVIAFLSKADAAMFILFLDNSN